MKIFFCGIFLTLLATRVFGQANYYDVTPSEGMGLRFWASDHYKIHMGNSGEYHFGPVTDYSIKMNMSEHTGRGWTWGLSGQTPVAALSNAGNLKIAGLLSALKLEGSGDNADLSILKLSNAAWACNQRTSIEFWNGGLKAFPTSRIVSQMDGCGGNGEALLFETQTAGASIPSAKVIIKNDGHVGIGTIDPYYKLDVVGNLRTSEQISASQYITVDKGGSYRVALNGQADGYIVGRNDLVEEKFVIAANGVSYFNGGNVGIGTETPGSFKLAVNGKIWTQEVNVAMTNPGPDYVFEPTYNLLPLSELESYIKANKHLPEVPSAKQMEEEGLNLKEMNLLLLKKVEELTLHLIELKKENIEQQTTIESQGKKINEIINQHR